MPTGNMQNANIWLTCGTQIENVPVDQRRDQQIMNPPKIGGHDNKPCFFWGGEIRERREGEVLTPVL